MHELPAVDLGGGDSGDGANLGLLGALRRQDDAAVATLAAELAANDCVVCTLGATGETLGKITEECERAWPYMRPGQVRSSDGSTVSGKSPSGADRGDRYVLSRDLPTDDGDHTSWPAIVDADAALGVVGGALAPALRADEHPKLAGLKLVKRSDTFVAGFSGEGLGYGAHFDGDEKCKITCILYTSEWEPEHGGCLHLLDEERKCWWAVPPRADTLVLFRSDRVLHKVEPCFAPRYALTVFMSLGRSEEDVERERAMLFRLMSSYV